MRASGIPPFALPRSMASSQEIGKANKGHSVLAPSPSPSWSRARHALSTVFPFSLSAMRFVQGRSHGEGGKTSPSRP